MQPQSVMKAPFPPSQDPPCSPSLSSASSRTDPEAPSPDAQPSSRICKARTRNGKVARLPKPLRDRINLLIRDGLSYRAILKKLGDDAQDLTLNNLSVASVSPHYLHSLMPQLGRLPLQSPRSQRYRGTTAPFRLQHASNLPRARIV